MKNPFKFLDSYTIDDRQIFFGRETDAKEIYTKFYSSKVTVIYGKSGVGKSSLIKCGLLSKILPEDIYMIHVRCGAVPEVNLLAALSHVSGITDHSISTQLETIFRQQFKPITLLIDQFEELFILATQENRNRFISLLGEIMKLKVRVNIAIVIREEYIANLIDLEKDIPSIFDNRIRIVKLTEDNVSDLIELPCKACGVKVEKGLAVEVKNKLTTVDGSIELTYFQILMDSLYNLAVKRDPEHPELRLSDLESLGEIDDVLGDFLNRELTSVKNGFEMERILKTLVSSEGTKTQKTMNDIRTETGLTTEIITKILQELVRKRIISEKDSKGFYEIKHDSIAKRVYDRLSSDEKKALEVRQLIYSRYEEFIKSGHYLDKETLVYIEPFLGFFKLPKEVIHFIMKSQRKVQDAKNYRLFITAVFVVIPMLVVIFWMGWIISDLRDEVKNKSQQISNIDVKNKKLPNIFTDEMVKVNAGEFYGYVTPEGRDTTITVDAFEIDKYEVSTLKYNIFCKETGRSMPKAPESSVWGLNYPIVNVNWNDAVAYCVWLSAKTEEPDDTVRLPYDSEWEYAARGCGIIQFDYGTSSHPSLVAVYGQAQPSEIGSKSPNTLKIYDMIGNVREWVQDADPTELSSKRITRGGCYASDTTTLKLGNDRVSYIFNASSGLESTGFRCVRIRKKAE